MKELIIYMRCLQLFYHNSHNLCARVPFFQDHEFFGDGYSAAESAYDSLVERHLGKFGDLDLISIQELAVQKLKSYPLSKDNASMFQIALGMEKQSCELIEKLCSEPLSQGTINLLAGLADESEVRQYLISRRLMK